MTHVKNHAAVHRADWSEVENQGLDQGNAADWLDATSDSRVGAALIRIVERTAEYVTAIDPEVQCWAWVACWEHCRTLFDQERHNDGKETK